MLASSCLLLPLALALSAQEAPPPNPLAEPWSPDSVVQSDYKFEDVFPLKPYTGKLARDLEWSSSDRYLAYLWNPYDDRSSDLWVHDTQSGKSVRVTSIEQMGQFDREAKKAVDRYKEDDADLERRGKMTLGQRREVELKQQEEDRKREEPKPSYPGISDAEWANGKDELLFVYRGDIYRWKVGDGEPTRLTRTRDSEFDPKYTKDDSGFFFRRGDGVYRMRFDSADVVQLNPELPHNLPLQRYSISPDESKLMIETGRELGGNRQVDYIVYRDRFAQARRTARDVADDPFRWQSYIFLYDLNDDPKTNPKHDGKPWEVWKFPGGDDNLMFSSIAPEPWSPDSARFVFATWDRKERKLEVKVADFGTKEVKTVLNETNNGEPTSTEFTNPFFTKDGKKIIALLENSGHRHVWLIDPLAQGATQLTKGDHYMVPIELTPDGNGVIVRGNRESTIQDALYRLDIADGELHRLGSQRGQYDDPVLSHNGEKLAVTFRSWSVRPELFLVGKGDDKPLTDSHRSGFESVYRTTPTHVTFTNRHGHTINASVVFPPNFRKEDKRPLLIYVYGGPLGWGRDVEDGRIGLYDQYLAHALGYVTMTVDTRGMSSYGAVFGSANYNQPGKPQVEDLSDGAKHMIETYGVDAEKVGVYGWSFGGFQTQMCMFTAPEVFKLGMAGAGPTQWQNYNTWYSTNTIGPGKVEEMDKFSLTHLAKNLQGPLMLLHGMEDLNVLYQDTVMVYRELLKYGKGPLVELVVDPTGDHGLGGDINRRDNYAIYTRFLLKHWGPWKPQTNP